MTLGLLFLMIIGMILETASIGLIFPILAVLTQDPNILNHELALWLESAFGLKSREDFVVFCAICILVLYVVKIAFMSLLAWIQASFIFGVHASVTQRLFRGYLARSYEYHLGKNSSEIIRNLTTEASMLASVIQSTLVLLTEIIVVLGLTTLMFLYEPIGTLVSVGVLISSALCFQLITRSHVREWGLRRQLNEGLRIKQIQEGLGAIKEIKLGFLEQHFSDGYVKVSNAWAKASRNYAAMQQLPRHWMEMFALLGFAGLVLVLINQGKTMIEIIPTVGLFAAAAFRIMPSANRMLVAFQSLRYASSVIRVLHDEMLASPELSKYIRETADDTKQDNKRITIDGLGYRYPGVSESSLSNISLRIEPGESLGIMGESGAGKSTFVNVLLGLLSDYDGEIKFGSQDTRSSIHEWRKKVGYVPQQIFLIDDSVLRNVALGIPDDEIDIDAVERAISDAQLNQFVEDLPDGLQTVLGESGARLSGGQSQRIGIARALYHDPDVLIFDEATSALDSKTEVAVMSAINKLKGSKTLIIIAHRTSTLADCDVVYRLENGRLFESAAPLTEYDVTS